MTVRKRASRLSPAEQARYIDVVTQLNSGPTPTTYGRFVAIHADMRHRMHGGMGLAGRERFLVWHRDFLMKFEQEMQRVDPLAFVPYWKWSTNRAIPPWIAGFTPTVRVPAVGGMGGGPATVQVARAPHLPAGLPTATQIASLDLNVALDFTHFTSLMEGYHNTVHGWVGGTMNNIQYSPADPLFWMNHAEVDRIWSLWQANPANAGKGPTLTGAAATLDPWPESAGQLSSIATLGYSYAP